MFIDKIKIAYFEDPITSLGEYALYQCSQIEEIVIPNSTFL